jgi:hypothetical protein
MARDASRGASERVVVATGNSRTRIPFETGWTVLDVGSGHSPHPRATILVERFLDSNHERAGRPVHLPAGTAIVVADAQALPFRDQSIDFAIYSHVAEHVEDPRALCEEARRVACAGYLESPSSFSELLRHPKNHRWRVRTRRDGLVFTSVGPSSPLGRLGDAIYGLYFYKGPQLVQQDVPAWSDGVGSRPLDRLLVLVSRGLRWFWRHAPRLTYARFRWQRDSEFGVRVTVRDLGDDVEVSPTR